MTQKLKFLLVLIIPAFIGCGDDELTFEEQLSKDIKSIDAYLSENNISATVHDSGLRYVINEKGDNTSPSFDSDITVTYTALLMSGEQQVDESTDPITFNLQLLIPAWQVGLPLIGQGGSMTLYAPSGMCYGTQGTGPIPPNANMIFTLNLIEVN